MTLPGVPWHPTPDRINPQPMEAKLLRGSTASLTRLIRSKGLGMTRGFGSADVSLMAN